MAKYVYDAWGNCQVLDKYGNAITDQTHVAHLNPIRWKSQYYDTDSGLYYIGNRWYDPETGRYISSANPESLLSNAAIVHALNLYAFVLENPVAVLLAASTFMASLDFYYDGEPKTWWEKNRLLVLQIAGVALVLIALIAAPFTCGTSTAVAKMGLVLLQMALAMGSAVLGLAAMGIAVGIYAALTGHSFWEAFSDTVSENYVEVLVTSFAMAALTVAVGTVIKCFQCFAEGTLVQTEEGMKAIEDIREGDMVLAYSEETGEQAYKPVTRLLRNKTDQWYHIYVNGEEIVCTAGHPFYILNADQFRTKVEFEGVKTDKDGKWICAKDLKIGDEVLTGDRSCAIIEEIQKETLVKAETTYNFEVEDFHTYYVSEECILVHNKCPKVFTEDQDAVQKLAKEAKRKGGLTESDADILMDWADEYKIPARGPEVSARPGIWHDTRHYHIGNIDHIPLKGGG